MGHHKCSKHQKKLDKLGNQKVQLVPFSQTTLISKASLSVPDSIWVSGATTLWRQGFDGTGIIIGVIDTGIDNTHPVLLNKVIKRRDYVKDNRPTTAYNPHGTHVAGTICADTILKGVAPKAKLMDYRVLDVNGSGTFANVTQAVRDAANDGCHIINMSLGGPVSYSPLRSAIQYAVSRGVIVVCAAGNSGPNKLSYPGAYPEVVSVGAVQFDSSTGNITLPMSPWFSNTNPEVDICADGWNVYSSVPGNKYATYSGTSMASPVVAGFCALMRNMMTKKQKRIPTVTELFSVLKSNTVGTNLNNPNLEGAGFCTLFPEIPKKVNGVWVLPSFLVDAP